MCLDEFHDVRTAYDTPEDGHFGGPDVAAGPVRAIAGADGALCCCGPVLSDSHLESALAGHLEVDRFRGGFNDGVLSGGFADALDSVPVCDAEECLANLSRTFAQFTKDSAEADIDKIDASSLPRPPEHPEHAQVGVITVVADEALRADRSRVGASGLGEAFDDAEGNTVDVAPTLLMEEGRVARKSAKKFQKSRKRAAMKVPRGADAAAVTASVSEYGVSNDDGVAIDPTADAAVVLCDQSQPCEEPSTLRLMQDAVVALLLAGSWQSSDGALWKVSKLRLATSDSDGCEVQVVLEEHHPPSGPAYRFVLVEATESRLNGYSVNTADFYDYCMEPVSANSGLAWMKPGFKDITWRLFTVEAVA